jgi:hypothetical protein
MTEHLLQQLPLDIATDICKRVHTMALTEVHHELYMRKLDIEAFLEEACKTLPPMSYGNHPQYTSLLKATFIHEMQVFADSFGPEFNLVLFLDPMRCIVYHERKWGKASTWFMMEMINGPGLAWAVVRFNASEGLDGHVALSITKTSLVGVLNHRGQTVQFHNLCTDFKNPDLLRKFCKWFGAASSFDLHQPCCFAQII